MLTYQVRPRQLRLRGSVAPRFPADVVVKIRLQPKQAFGDANEGGRTLVQHASTCSIMFNTNNGQYWSNTGGALKPLEVRAKDGSLSLDGHVLTLRQRCENAQQVQSLIESTCFVLPSLLALEFADPPYVEAVSGTIGAVEFTWELAALLLPLTVTNKETLESAFARAYDDLAVVATPHRRRLVAALNYYFTGCRLLRESKTVAEFMSEALLNFSKVLEILYGTKPVEKLKEGLKALGYTREEIDHDFLVIVDLRNSMDVGHPELSLFTLQQLETLHWFAERSEHVIGELLKRLLAAIRSGTLDVKPRVAGPPDATTAKVIARLTKLREAAEQDSAGKDKLMLKLDRTVRDEQKP